MTALDANLKGGHFFWSGQQRLLQRDSKAQR